MTNLNQTATIKLEQKDQVALQVTGKQEFMGKEIPVVLGGFGDNKKAISDKAIAEIHGISVSDVRKAINRNAERFKTAIDLIDLKSSSPDDDLPQNLGYSKQQVIQAEHIYILSERGYAKLIKIMDSDLAWEIHDKLIDEYFELREETTSLNNLSPQLQLLINLELEQKRIQQAIISTNERIDHISDIVALNTANWRQDTKHLISKIAVTFGGYDYIKEVNNLIYTQLDSRLGVNLKQRQINKRDRLAREGVCKSTRDKVTLLDVIADDKKLIEGYLAIVKEMAIQHGVDDVLKRV